MKRFAAVSVATDESAAEEAAYLYDSIQVDAEATLDAIEAMKAAGVTVSDGAASSVHQELAKVGLRYEPREDPFAGMEIPSRDDG